LEDYKIYNEEKKETQAASGLVTEEEQKSWDA